jgi:hypothetical protein
MRTARRPLLIAMLATVTLVATACSGGSSGGDGSPTPGDSSPGTTPPPSSAPPANVTADQDVVAWVTAVCDASAKTLNPKSFQYDPSEIAADPQAAVKKLTKQFKAFPAQLRAFADELEQLGAPDIANGEEFTNAYIDASRALADGLDKGVQDAEKTDGALEGFQAISGALTSAEVQSAIDELAKTGQSLASDEELSAAIDQVPACQQLK